ncbi:MAG TPA: hypothetical protein VGJ20_40170 [Xanthobacteraceae bacterium]
MTSGGDVPPPIKTKRKNKPCAGRPTTYNVELAAQICESIGNGMSMTKVCAAPGMPSPSTVYLWLGAHPEFVIMYQAALLARFDMWAEELVKVAQRKTDDIADQRLKTLVLLAFAEAIRLDARFVAPVGHGLTARGIGRCQECR